MKRKKRKPVSDEVIRKGWKLYLDCADLGKAAASIDMTREAFRARIVRMGLYEPRVQRRNYTINDCKAWANANDPNGKGKCLSKQYLGQNTKHIWKCSNVNHPPFDATAKSIMNGSWCQLCYNDRRSEAVSQYTTENCHQLAASRKGEFLSKVYHGGKLIWKCEFGHRFEKSRAKIANLNQWCPWCQKFVGQEFTRFVFESIFGKRFSSATLKSLGIADSKIELDGFCEELRLAFEYNGVYHTEDVNHSLYSPETLKNDIIKQEACVNNNITLIVIPEFPSPKIDRWVYIENLLKKNNISIPDYLRPQCLPDTFRAKYHFEIKTLVENRKGKLLTPVVMSATDPVIILCDKGHRVETLTPHKLKQGQWCRHNMQNRTLTERDYRLRAANVRSEYIDSRMDGTNKILRHRCEEGHIYERRLSAIRDGKGCNHPDHIGPTIFPKYEQRHDKFSE